MDISERNHSFLRDRYDDYVRERAIRELEEIKQMRAKIDALAKYQARKASMVLKQESDIQDQKEKLMARFKEAERVSLHAKAERERIEDAKKSYIQR